MITQTELYAHFMSRKITGQDVQEGQMLSQLDEPKNELNASLTFLKDDDNYGKQHILISFHDIKLFIKNYS